MYKSLVALLVTIVSFQSVGYGQIAKDSIKRVRKETSAKSWVQHFEVPAALVGAGFIAMTDNEVFSAAEFREERDEELPTFHVGVDNYLQFAPIVLAYGLDVAGVKGKHDLKDKSILFLKSEAMMLAVVFPMKRLTHVLRPDGSAHTSFPSGHTAQAFMAATFFTKEYGHLGPWVGVMSYTIATSVGVFRVLNDRHWASDVLVGAGIGMAATEIAYLTHHRVKKRMSSHLQWVACPAYFGKGQLGGMVGLKF